MAVPVLAIGAGDLSAEAGDPYLAQDAHSSRLVLRTLLQNLVRATMIAPTMPKTFSTFSAFYPVYLRMHDHPVNRWLHIIGNVLGVGAIGTAIVMHHLWMLVLAPLVANGLAWTGHFFFQGNRPGVFSYPFYGMLGSWRMTWEHLAGRR